jgi:hypothetical protein
LVFTVFAYFRLKLIIQSYLDIWWTCQSSRPAQQGNHYQGISDMGGSKGPQGGTRKYLYFAWTWGARRVVGGHQEPSKGRWVFRASFIPTEWRTRFSALSESEPTPISTIQQQQAEQMRVYWKVSLFLLSLVLRCFKVLCIVVHRGNAYQLGIFAAWSNTIYA